MCGNTIASNRSSSFGSNLSSRCAIHRRQRDHAARRIIPAGIGASPARSPVRMKLRHTLAGGTSHMRPIYAVATRNVAGALAPLVLGGPIAHRAPGDPVVVSARVWGWKVALSASTVPAGTVTFTVTNAGTIPHAFEIEGHGIEKQTEQIQPGSTATLTLTLKLGTYDVYCPVGEDSHKKLGMETHLKVAGAQSSGAPGYGGSEMSESHETARAGDSGSTACRRRMCRIIPASAA